MNPATMPVEAAVKQPSAGGAQAHGAALCRPVEYDPQDLQGIPQKVIERDYTGR